MFSLAIARSGVLNVSYTQERCVGWSSSLLMRMRLFSIIQSSICSPLLLRSAYSQLKECVHWSRQWWVGCGWPVEECVVAGLCLVGIVGDRYDLSTLKDNPDDKVLTVSLWSPCLHSRDGVSDKGNYSSLVSIYSVMPEELVLSKGEAMSICQVGFLNADDVNSLLFISSCSTGFFFRSPSPFYGAKTSGTADVSGWLDWLFTCWLLFSSWVTLPVAAGGPLWGWGPGTVTAWCSTGRAPSRRMSVFRAMLGIVRSDWSSHDLVTQQEVCPLSSAITSDFWAANGLGLECSSPRLVASTSYRVQSIRPVTPGWEFTWPFGHADLLHPGRWLSKPAHPPSGAMWTTPPYEV